MPSAAINVTMLIMAVNPTNPCHIWWQDESMTEKQRFQNSDCGLKKGEDLGGFGWIWVDSIFRRTQESEFETHSKNF